MQKLSKKRLLKHRTMILLEDLLKSLVTPEQASSITRDSVMAQLGKRTYYKNQDTGVVRLGLCYKQVRKEVKANPYITVDELKEKHNLV